jgi:hypothetical protein
MADPKPGEPGYQEWLNKQIAEHDREVKGTSESQDFEIAPPQEAR